MLPYHTKTENLPLQWILTSYIFMILVTLLYKELIKHKLYFLLSLFTEGDKFNVFSYPYSTLYKRMNG